MRRKISILGVLLFAAAAGTVFGQMIPTGKLLGTVSDTNNVPLPGVTITISSPSLILPQLAAVTNERGLYKFFSLPSGQFKVVFEIQGFKTLIREGIIINAESTTTLDVRLEQGAIQESVTVVGQAPVVDLQKTQTGTTFNKDLLQSLPLPRDLSNIFNAAPGMFARTSHGSDARANDFVVDGVKMQDPVTGDPYQTVPWNAIDEVEIETSNQKAEYGTVKGALVQVITKAGGNSFGGGLNFYFRNKSLQSDNTKGTQLEGQFVGFRWQYIPGFSFGGPIKKDKVWFFTSLDVDRNSAYIQSFPAPTTVGGTPPQSLPTAQDTYAPFAKVTWQLNPKNRIVASGYWRKYGWDHRDAGWWTIADANARENSAVTLGTVQWSNTLSNNLFFNLKTSWYALHQYILARDTLSPHWDLEDGVNRGGYGSDWWYYRRRLQANGDLTYFLDNWLGSHELKTGFSFEYAYDVTDNQYYQDPHFPAGTFPAGFKAVDVEYWDGVPLDTWVGEEYRSRNNLIQSGGFVQDTWSPTKSLTVNLGLRLDMAKSMYPPQKKKGTGEWVNQQTITAMSFTMFSPRFGVSYDPFGTGKTVLKANYGRYYSPLTGIFTYFNNPNQRSWFIAFLLPDYTVDYTWPINSPALNSIDPNTKSPYADEINFGFERELIEDMSFSTMVILKWERNLIDDVDGGHANIDLFRQTGQLEWTGYHAVTGTDPLTGNPATFYEWDSDFGNFAYVTMNIPGTSRKYRGLEFKLTKRMSRRWAMQASYVWSRGTGILNTSRDQSTGASGFFDDPNTMINAYGRLDYQREHLVKVQGTYLGPWGINLSAYYQFGSGVPYTRRLRSIEAGLSLYQGAVTIYVEPRGTEKMPDQHLLDVRLEKTFNVWRGQIGLQVDAYNLFNNNRATSVGSLTNVDWSSTLQRVYSIMSPRYIQFGVVYRF
jgi:outer membrane receptor protein involved in Fe transport